MDCFIFGVVCVVVLNKLLFVVIIVYVCVVFNEDKVFVVFLLKVGCVLVYI